MEPKENSWRGARRGPSGGSQAGCRRPELGLRLHEWDTLEAAEQAALYAHARECGDCGPKLDLLQRAEAWLEQQARVPATVASVCPSAEELYDFGRGPGARAMSEPERLSLKSHLLGCTECAELVETLAARPPVPLIDERGEAAGDDDDLVRSLPRSSRLRRLAWIPLAAAAALAAVAFWPKDAPTRAGEPVASAAIRYPAPAVLRGASDDALLYPRDRLLRGESAFFAAPVFELRPRERATGYRVRLFRHDGSAFARGTQVLELTSADPALESSVGASEVWPPGHYTWEAWATADGLEVHLGRRDFEVVVDAVLVAAIDARRDAPEPSRSASILHLLHDAGFVADARAFARSLPASTERDAYLARVPGR